VSYIPALPHCFENATQRQWFYYLFALGEAGPRGATQQTCTYFIVVIEFSSLFSSFWKKMLILLPLKFRKS
jgi:hypothetical protein